MSKKSLLSHDLKKTVLLETISTLRDIANNGTSDRERVVACQVLLDLLKS